MDLVVDGSLAPFTPRVKKKESSSSPSKSNTYVNSISHSRNSHHISYQSKTFEIRDNSLSPAYKPMQ